MDSVFAKIVSNVQVTWLSWPGPLGVAAGLVAGGALHATSLQAAEWDTSASVGASSFFTDNFCLTNDQKESEVVHAVTPTVGLSGNGARASINLNASVQYNSASDSDIVCGRGASEVDNRRNQSPVVPRGRATGRLELIENWLTLDANASASQNRANAFLAGGGDNLDGTSNINTTVQYGAGATVQRRLSPVSELFARYSYTSQQNDVRRVGDSQVESSIVRLTSNPNRGPLTLVATGNYTDTTFERRQTDIGGVQPPGSAEFASATIQALWQLSRKWQVNGLYGEERNDFVSTFQDNDGSFWDVGLQWTPNTRVTASAGYGRRFFGDTPRAQVSYRHKRSSLQFAYVRSVTTNVSLRTLDVLDENVDPGLDEPFDEQGIPTSRGNSVIINEQLSATYSLSGRRSSLVLRASDSQQTRAIDGGAQAFRILSLALSRTLSPQLDANLRLSWDERDASEGDAVDFFRPSSETWTARLSLNRRLGNQTTLRLAYSYRLRESEAAFNEFSENRVEATISYRFQ